jgi:carbon starvation protein
VATGLAVGSCLLLAFGAQAPGGGVGSGGLVIWPLFGTTNQLLAALSLVVVTVYLKRLGRSTAPTVVPLVFLLGMTIWAMLITLGSWLLGERPNYVLAALGLVVLGAAGWMVVESLAALRGPRAAPGAQEPAA